VPSANLTAHIHLSADDVVAGLEFDRVRVARRQHLNRQQRRRHHGPARVRRLGRHRRWGKTLASTGLLVGYDSVTPGNIPSDAPVVAGYIDGFYAWPQSAWDRFTGFRLSIAVHPSTNAGDVLDIETGDATPSQGPGWVAMRRRSGHPNPGVYCSAAILGQVLAAFDAAGVARPWVWVAAYPGCGQSLCGYTNGIGHQYGDVGPYDLTVWDPSITTIHGGPAPVPDDGVSMYSPDDLRGFARSGAIDAVEIVLQGDANTINTLLSIGTHCLQYLNDPGYEASKMTLQDVFHHTPIGVRPDGSVVELGEALRGIWNKAYASDPTQQLHWITPAAPAPVTAADLVVPDAERKLREIRAG
jgi:hypothetical protein